MKRHKKASKENSRAPFVYGYARRFTHTRVKTFWKEVSGDAPVGVCGRVW
ncbi:hypothetical protein [Hoylesella pleuritidis]|nr:hypothetical protein [Hoylesella pleuritidis]